MPNHEHEANMTVFFHNYVKGGCFDCFSISIVFLDDQISLQELGAGFIECDINMNLIHWQSTLGKVDPSSTTYHVNLVNHAHKMESSS